MILVACSAPPVTAAPKRTYAAVKLLSQFTIPRTNFKDLTISELSGLAWDQDEQLLYAVSDQGRIFHFKLKLDHEQITAVEPVFAATLVDNKGKPIKLRDSEGLFALNANNRKKGDTQLIVSFEHGPRIYRMSPQGRQVGVVPLHQDLQNPKAYRSQNSMLESVAYHPKYGFLTAPERSLKGEPDNLQTIYSTKQKWSFLAYPAENSSVTGLEILPDKSLLVLERAWAGILHPMVISLRRVDLEACGKAKVCEVQDLGVYSSLIQVDNFEGLTQIRDNLYLMVSDDGERELLRTQLSLFKVE
ncbi:esterase-like activity of phytase family protein [uncultured Thiothrix sp.]|uniref:esterase-like activity of phytase family protein n=1 Tax=uncultured Thiothrix sp. TaxID=223185 RepID=UPI00262C8618|nr:esterase-like activity of phytase family protein [uncultured Thiothrix sp.]HMT91665.1 esterase-like activity of phytase family protein [Thiolinea sp.]